MFGCIGYGFGGVIVLFWEVDFDCVVLLGLGNGCYPRLRPRAYVCCVWLVEWVLFWEVDFSV